MVDNRQHPRRLRFRSFIVIGNSDQLIERQFVWILAPGTYYSNIFFAKYLPFSSANIYDNK